MTMTKIAVLIPRYLIAVLIPRHLQAQFENFLLKNGDVQELNLNQVLPLREDPEDLKEVNQIEKYTIWGTKTNPVVSKIEHNQDDQSFFITYSINAEMLSQKLLGALCLALQANIEYLCFDGSEYLAKPFKYCEPIFEGDEPWFMVGLSDKTIDDVCKVFFDMTYEQYKLNK